MFSNLFNWFIIVISFIASVFGIGQFFGVDWRWVQEQMTAHYWFSILTIVSLSGFVWSIVALWRRSHIRPENVQRRIRAWLDAFSLGNRTIANPSWHFAYEVTLITGVPILVLRSRDHPHYVTLLGQIEMIAEQRQAYQNLSPAERAGFQRAVRLEAAKAKIPYQADMDWNRIVIERRLPITKNLTESYLLDGLGEINFGVLVMLEQIDALLGNPRPPSPTSGTATPQQPAT